MFDLLLCTIIIVCTALGFVNGFIKSTLSLLFFFLSFFITINFHDLLVSSLQINPVLISHIISALLIYSISAITFAIINSLLCNVLKPISLGVVDKSLGFFLGAFKGWAICLIICISIKSTYFIINNNKEEYKDVPTWFLNTKSYDWIAKSENAFNDIISINTSNLISTQIQKLADIIEKIEQENIKDKSPSEK